MNGQYAWVISARKINRTFDGTEVEWDSLIGVAANANRAKLMALSAVADTVKQMVDDVTHRDLEVLAEAAFSLAQINDGTEAKELAFTTRHVISIERTKIHE